MREAGARRRIGNTDEMLARRTLNLPPGVARVAFQGLIAMGTIKFEFGCAHHLHLHHAQTGRVYERFIHTFCPANAHVD
jgi:hypothetical protein